jgi:O-antigen ligase
LLVPDRRLRAVALLAALGLALALLLGEGWSQLESLRDRPAAFAGLVLFGAAALVGLAVFMRRFPVALPLLIAGALPFRIPIDVGGDDVNLLIPVYAVIAAGVLAFALDALGKGDDDGDPRPRPRLLLVALSAAVALYAVQATYSTDLSFAARNLGFFLVPFAVMFALLLEVRWTPRLLGLALAVVLGEAVVFSLVGVAQHAVGEIFWNPALERSNEFHFYFRVNSLFWDPNIYGRYVALAAVLALAVTMWVRDGRRLAYLAAVLLALLAGLISALSQTSFLAVLAGATVLCALRVSWKWTLIAAPFALAVVVAAVVVIGGTSEAEDEASEVSSGRTTLLEGGVDLAKEKPLWGHGSASFGQAFAEQEDVNQNQTTVSHNEVITVAAEQGAIGLLVYLGTVAAGLWTLFAGLRRIAPGFDGPPGSPGDPFDGGDAATGVARMALLAAFAALLVHTIGYGGFLTDPLTWALLAVGAALSSE